ncbi:MAG: glycosyltransferase family 39 protein [Pseudomonadota bacterium]
MVNERSNSSWQKDFLLLFVLIFLFFCIGLGVRPYITPSEARYIEIPRQMLATGDFITPHINAVQYFEKPPLFYWMQAFFLNLGNNEFMGRMATTLVVTLTCLVTYATGRLLYNRMTGLLAAASLATSVMGYCLSRVAMLDAPVTLFITCTISSFIFAQVTRRKKFYYFMYASAALAVMTKGLIGIVIPGLVIGSWIIFTKNWKILKEARLFTGTLLFLAIAAPWHILMAMEHPQFLDFYFIHEHFNRFLSNEHRRTAPWWFFIVVTLVGAIPWIFFVIPHLMRNLGHQIKSIVISKDSHFHKDNKLFLIIWILLPLLFFSSSNSKLIPYIFPIFPPIFILIGHRLANIWAIRKDLIISAMGIMVAIFISANYIAPKFDERSIKPLTDLLKPQLKDDDIVVSYNSYFQDLPVYLDRNVIIAGWTGELHFGTKYTPNAKDWMIDLDDFWEKCAAAKTSVYVFIKLEDYKNIKENMDCKLHELSQYGKTLLLKKEIEQYSVN